MSFMKPAPNPNYDGGVMKVTPGTRFGGQLIESFRYRRTARIGAELPGRLMLVPPPLPNGKSRV